MAFELLQNSADTPAVDVHEAATETLAEHGFESGDTDVGMYHGTGHGVGVSLHEASLLSSAASLLEVGHVVTVESGVYDPERGSVRPEDLVITTSSALGRELFPAFRNEQRTVDVLLTPFVDEAVLDLVLTAACKDVPLGRKPKRQ